MTKKPTMRVIVVARSSGDVSYRAPVYDTTTVLEALEYIRVHCEPTLLYRHSCHHGSCGTCGMLINNQRRLACLTKIVDIEQDVIRLAPLDTQEVIADLATSPKRLLDEFPEGATYIRDSETDSGGRPPAEAGGRYRRLEDCIECGLCVSACPVAKSFIGPAALAAYNRERVNRPSREEEILERVGRNDGAARCERHLACNAACPSNVYPAKHIAQLRKAVERRADKERPDK